MKYRLLSVAVAAAMGISATAAEAGTLDDVKKRGFVQCGVSQGLPGFSNADDKKNWSGLDVDLCRALGAAIFNDDKKVKYTPLSVKERFLALQTGEVDVLARNTSWTATYDITLGLNFVGVNYYDAQVFMVRKDLGVASAFELNDVSVCASIGSASEQNAADFFSANKMKFKVMSFDEADEVIQAYDSGFCDVFTTELSGMQAQRLKLKDQSKHVILPELISKEPLGPVVRQGDDQWFNLVKWTLYAMINAEELGITSANVDEKKSDGSPAENRLLGVEGEFGEKLGLSNQWAYNIVKLVGNYEEIFNRNLGPDTPLAIDRGINALWSKGGIQYAPPIR